MAKRRLYLVQGRDVPKYDLGVEQFIRKDSMLRRVRGDPPLGGVLLLARHHEPPQQERNARDRCDLEDRLVRNGTCERG